MATYAERYHIYRYGFKFDHYKASYYAWKGLWEAIMKEQLKIYGL